MHSGDETAHDMHQAKMAARTAGKTQAPPHAQAKPRNQPTRDSREEPELQKPPSTEKSRFSAEKQDAPARTARLKPQQALDVLRRKHQIIRKKLYKAESPPYNAPFFRAGV